MDIVLEVCENNLLGPYIYGQNFSWPKDSLGRQFLSLLFLVTLGGYFLYFFTAGLSYILVFDKRLMKHPLFLNVKLSIIIGIKFWHSYVCTHMTRLILHFSTICRIKFGKRYNFHASQYHL